MLTIYSLFVKNYSLRVPVSWRHDKSLFMNVISYTKLFRFVVAVVFVVLLSPPPSFLSLRFNVYWGQYIRIYSYLCLYVVYCALFSLHYFFGSFSLFSPSCVSHWFGASVFLPRFSILGVFVYSFYSMWNIFCLNFACVNRIKKSGRLINKYKIIFECTRIIPDTFYLFFSIFLYYETISIR